MSVRNPRARYVLPEHIDAPRLCFKVPVPNDPQHIAAFLGAIRSLGSWYSWQEDPTHKASKVSAVWRKIGDNLKPQDCTVDVANIGGDIEDCMKLRIDPDNSCIIQCFDDCSQTWGTFLDVSSCVPGAAGQPNPGGTPSAGTENCYDILIAGNSQWISPVPVKDGDSIVISAVGGGWFDGAGWFCPNGQGYVLGACTGSPVFSGSDPAPSIAHARLIGTLDSGASWNDAYNTTIPILPGTAPTNLILQMNDPSLSDNGGSIHLKVCITTNNPTNWTHDFDFTTSSGGWNPLSTATAQWLTTVGWSSGAPGGAPEDCVIDFIALHPCTITVWDTVCNVSAVHQSYQGAQYRHNGSSFFSNNALAETPGGTLSFAGTLLITPGDDIQCSFNVSGSPLGTAVQVSMHFEGTGTNPFI
jgi:hypothetical protein